MREASQPGINMGERLAQLPRQAGIGTEPNQRFARHPGDQAQMQPLSLPCHRRDGRAVDRRHYPRYRYRAAAPLEASQRLDLEIGDFRRFPGIRDLRNEPAAVSCVDTKVLVSLADQCRQRAVHAVVPLEQALYCLGGQCGWRGARYVHEYPAAFGAVTVLIVVTNYRF